MKIKYLSYRQAAAISADFQHLVGRPFDETDGAGGTVQQIMIAPYSRILQWKFIHSILHGTMPDTALSICRNGRYDVIVLPERCCQTEAGFRVKSLRDYLQERMIDFSPGLYNCLRTF